MTTPHPFGQQIVRFPALCFPGPGRITPQTNKNKSLSTLPVLWEATGTRTSLRQPKAMPCIASRKVWDTWLGNPGGPWALLGHLTYFATDAVSIKNKKKRFYRPKTT